jgi:hypothetical protein
MAIVLEKYTTEKQRSVVRFLWVKVLNAKNIHKEIFPVYGAKCLSHKAVYNWVEKHGIYLADDEEVETEVMKWLRQQSKDFSCAGFDTQVKRWDEDMSKKKFFFLGSNITCFTFYIHL